MWFTNIGSCNFARWRASQGFQVSKLQNAGSQCRDTLSILWHECTEAKNWFLRFWIVEGLEAFSATCNQSMDVLLNVFTLEGISNARLPNGQRHYVFPIWNRPETIHETKYIFFLIFFYWILKHIHKKKNMNTNKGNKKNMHMHNSNTLEKRLRRKQILIQTHNFIYLYIYLYLS